MGEIMTMVAAYLAIASIGCGFFSMAMMGPWVMIRIDLSDRVAIPVDLFMSASLIAMTVALLTV